MGLMLEKRKRESEALVAVVLPISHANFPMRSVKLMIDSILKDNVGAESIEYWTKAWALSGIILSCTLENGFLSMA